VQRAGGARTVSARLELPGCTGMAPSMDIGSVQRAAQGLRPGWRRTLRQTLRHALTALTTLVAAAALLSAPTPAFAADCVKDAEVCAEVPATRIISRSAV